MRHILGTFGIDFMIAFVIGAFVRLGYDAPEWWQVLLVALVVGFVGSLFRLWSDRRESNASHTLRLHQNLNLLTLD